MRRYDEPIEVAVVAELNPVSAETMAEVRRWLSAIAADQTISA